MARSHDWVNLAREIHDSRTARANARGTPYAMAETILGRSLSHRERVMFKIAWDALMGKPPLGTGERFASLEAKLAHRKNYHARDVGALAAYIGRRTYGKAQFQKMAAAGKAAHRKKT